MPPCVYRWVYLSIYASLCVYGGYTLLYMPPCVYMVGILLYMPPCVCIWWVYTLYACSPGTMVGIHPSAHVARVPWWVYASAQRASQLPKVDKPLRREPPCFLGYEGIMLGRGPPCLLGYEGIMLGREPHGLPDVRESCWEESLPGSLFDEGVRVNVVNVPPWGGGERGLMLVNVPPWGGGRRNLPWYTPVLSPWQSGAGLTTPSLPWVHLAHGQAGQHCMVGAYSGLR